MAFRKATHAEVAPRAWARIADHRSVSDELIDEKSAGAWRVVAWRNGLCSRKRRRDLMLQLDPSTYFSQRSGGNLEAIDGMR